MRNRKKRRPKYILIGTGSILTILATAVSSTLMALGFREVLMFARCQKMIVNIVRNCQGFLNVGPALPGGPEQYFNDASQPTFVIKSCIYNVQTVILDAVVVRC